MEAGILFQVAGAETLNECLWTTYVLQVTDRAVAVDVDAKSLNKTLNKNLCYCRRTIRKGFIFLEPTISFAVAS